MCFVTKYHDLLCADQVNKAIQQLDSVIQENSATSEETASMAEELASQADYLQQSMRFFTLDNEEETNVAKASGSVAARQKRRDARKPASFTRPTDEQDADDGYPFNMPNPEADNDRAASGPTGFWKNPSAFSASRN